MNRPTALPVNIDGIPDALKAERRWMLWRYEQQNGRWTKPPFTCRGHRARHNQAEAWSTFGEVVAAYQDGGFDGLSFALGTGWAGIDLDKCRLDDTTIPDAQAEVEQLQRAGVYVDVSPSGTGYKAFGRATRIGGEIKFDHQPPAFTPWSSARFFVITGHGQGDPTASLATVIDNWFPAPATGFRDRPTFIREGDTRGTELIERRSDDEVLTLAATAMNRDKFLKLFRGDASDYADDHSRADQALCTILAYWCIGDLDQVDRLFRQSGLMREKWLTRSYRLATLRKAVAQ